MRVRDTPLVKGVDGQHLTSRDPIVFNGALVLELESSRQIDELQDVRAWVWIVFGHRTRDVEVAHREDGKVGDGPARLLEHFAMEGVFQGLTGPAPTPGHNVFVTRWLSNDENVF